MVCPACSSVMTARCFGAVDCHICDQCAGIFVPIMKSLALFRGMEDDDEPEPPPMEGAPQATHCPKGHGPLEAFGYMGSSLMIARCNDCAHLWVAGDKRHPVRNKWRKAQGRIERLLEEKHEAMRDLTVGAGIVGPKGQGRKLRAATIAGRRQERIAQLRRELLKEDIDDSPPESEAAISDGGLDWRVVEGREG
jgi:hypothetical protein